MRSNRGLRPLSVVFALALVVSCTAGDTTSPEVSLGLGNEAPTQPSGLASLNGVSSVTDLLSCKPQPYLATTKLVGIKGGKVKVGKHVLRIPEGALSQDVTIVAEQITGSTNSVRFSPEGLNFAKPAELTMGYDNCAVVIPAKRIAYTSELFQILELLPSEDKFQTKTVTSPIDHFSRYAVAF